MTKLVDVYYRDKETGEVSIHSMWEISANESLRKWPKEYSLKLPRGVDPAKIKDLRPLKLTDADFAQDQRIAKGPPIIKQTQPIGEVVKERVRAIGKGIPRYPRL